jgi:site-specific DNA recombinase
MFTIMKKPFISTVILIYTRVSTEQQSLSGIGLSSQETKCREHAQKLNFEVREIFSDNGISGQEGLDNRPGLQKLLETTKNLRKLRIRPIVVIYSISRLARRMKLLWDLLEGEKLEISSATEHFDTSTPTGRALVGMLGVFAQLEADLAAERTRDALAEVKSQGKQLGRRFSSQMAPESVAIVKKLHQNGLSLRAIVAELTLRQIPSPMGKNWHVASVRRVLKQ